MLRLSNWKILNKLLLLIGVMAGIIATVAGVGVFALRGLVEDQEQVVSGFTESVTGARINQNVLALSRAEYRIASDPSPETFREVQGYVGEFRQQLEARLSELKKSADAEQLKLLQALEAEYRAYMTELNGTFDKVRQHGDKVSLSEAQKVISDSVRASRVVSDRLQQRTRDFVVASIDHSNKVAADAARHASSLQTTMISVALAGILGGIALGFMLASLGIAKPLAQSIANINQLARGDLKVDIFGASRRDEIGQVAAALQIFKDNMTETERLKAEQETAKARAEADKKAAMNKMADDFDRAVGGIVQSVSSQATQLQSAAQGMTATAEETQRQSTAVAAASEQASSNVQTVASAAEELSGSISEIGRQVSESTRIAAQAVQDAARTNAQVQALAEAAQKIGDVVKLINDIAGQTNLLALNATIEAARAGEAGKGFAVVASEVKSLATQTGKATEDIANQVKAIQSATTDSVQAIQSIGQTIGRINEIATTIASAVEEQGAATKEISRNVQQASAGTSEVSANISGVTQAATETGSAAAQVLSSSGELAQQGETLRAQVSRFLDTVRAA